MNSLWDIRISLGLVPKEPPCINDTLRCPKGIRGDHMEQICGFVSVRAHDAEYSVYL